jgi:hypothetical protein
MLSAMRLEDFISALERPLRGNGQLVSLRSVLELYIRQRAPDSNRIIHRCPQLQDAGTS